MNFSLRIALSMLIAFLSAVAIAQNVVQNPTASQTITQPSATSFTVRGSTVLQNVSNLNTVLWVDGSKYTTLSACYTALPSTGGTCMVPPNYTETLASSLSLSKNNSGFIFTGPATITAGTNTISVPVGARGAFIEGYGPAQNSTTACGVNFSYTGSGTFITVGANTGSTVGFRMKNVCLLLQSAGNSSVGIDLIQTVFYTLDTVFVFGNSNTSTTQKCIILDGTGLYAGSGTMINTLEQACNIGIQFIGSGFNAGNANTIIDNTIDGLSGTNSTCIDFQASSGANMVIGGDCENVITAVHFENSSQGNEVWLRDENITHDVVFDSGTLNNIVHMLVPLRSISDSGTHNSVTSPDLNQHNGYLWREFASSTYWGVSDNVSDLSRIYMNSSNTFVSAEGSGGVIFNAGSGTGGVVFYNGAGTQVALVDGSGNATFNGNLTVSGVKSFRIDDPLDPEKKYLYHAAVESPDMKNIYDGVVTLGAKGTATVNLPEYFQALNKDFRYQLTCVGGSAPVYVAREIHNNRFIIAGGRPGLKVSWQVTGIRHDRYADAHRMVVEQEKPEEETLKFPSSTQPPPQRLQPANPD